MLLTSTRCLKERTKRGLLTRLRAVEEMCVLVQLCLYLFFLLNYICFMPKCTVIHVQLEEREREREDEGSITKLAEGEREE